MGRLSFGIFVSIILLRTRFQSFKSTQMFNAW